ncbi:hypothetical protein GmRootA79_02050 [Acidovorax sp. A79]|uniref:hypothetical protein n=1 Tax=Acidovorax sp. A79 TaxID=3056107 RepID=UPI0034E86565
MRIQDPLELFRFGQAFKALQLMSVESKYEDVERYFVCLEDFLEKNNYKISSRVFSTTVKPVWMEIARISTGEHIGANRKKKLLREMNTLLPTIRAESEGQKFFIVVEKRYSTDKLLNDICSLFAKDVFANLSEIAQFDIKQAGKCIVLECPTAAAFHLMRACEGEIASLYRRLSGDANVPNNGTWGDYENKIRALPNKPPDEYLEQVRHIRRNFRNPTQHPDKIYDIDEVQDLFNLAIDLINRTSRV